MRQLRVDMSTAVDVAWRVMTADREGRRRRQISDAAYMEALGRMVIAAGKRVAQADEEQLAQLCEIQRVLELAITDAVRGLRLSGVTWSAIGDLTGTTRQGAQQRWGPRLDGAA